MAMNRRPLAASVLLLLLPAAAAFQSTHLPKPLTANRIAFEVPVRFEYHTEYHSHWIPPSSTSTELRTFHENVFSSLAETTTATASATRDYYLKATNAVTSSRTATTVAQASQSILPFLRLYYWTIPAFLALVPLYTTFVLGIGDAAMPHWWSVTRMDHIVQAPDAAMVLSVFLGSNIAFFLGGGYLLKKFPGDIRSPTTEGISPEQGATSNRLSCLRTNIMQSWKTTRQTWLGILLLVSGLISTIFHTEQALGSFSIANSLCYLDHAVADTSTFYYAHTCGCPSIGLGGIDRSEHCSSVSHSRICLVAFCLAFFGHGRGRPVGSGKQQSGKLSQCTQESSLMGGINAGR